jgi:hypothetical protein
MDRLRGGMLLLVGVLVASNLVMLASASDPVGRFGDANIEVKWSCPCEEFCPKAHLMALYARGIV